MKRFYIILMLVGAALIGFLIPQQGHLDRGDAAIFSSLLGVTVWGLYHLLGLHRLSGKRAALAVVGAFIFWGALVFCVMFLFHENKLPTIPDLRVQ